MQWSDLIGTGLGYFRLGKAGVRLKDVAGALVVRDAADSADAIILPQSLGTGVRNGTKYLRDDGTWQLAGAAPVFTPVLSNDLVATTETVIASFAIPANTLVAGDNLDLDLHGQVSSTATLVFRLRIGTTGTAADALLCQFGTSAAGVANAYHYLNGVVSFLSAVTATATGISQLASGTVGRTTLAFAAAAINLTVANFITVTCVQSVAQTYTSRAASLKK